MNTKSIIHLLITIFFTLFAFVFFTNAVSAIHEIESLLCILIAVVSMLGIDIPEPNIETPIDE